MKIANAECNYKWDIDVRQLGEGRSQSTDLISMHQVNCINRPRLFALGTSLRYELVATSNGWRPITCKWQVHPSVELQQQRCHDAPGRCWRSAEVGCVHDAVEYNGHKHNNNCKSELEQTNAFPKVCPLWMWMCMWMWREPWQTLLAQRRDLEMPFVFRNFNLLFCVAHK